jgi:dienelactone hydrolase
VRRRSLLLILVASLALVVAAPVAARYQRGAALVIKSAGMHGWPERVAGINASHVKVTPADVPSRGGTLRGRTYRPEAGFERVVALFPGVHAAGIDEPRLVGFAEHLAERGLAVLTVELPDLKGYGVTPRTTDQIEDAARWLSTQRELSPDGRVGMMGISFGGGLTLVAAGRPAIKDRVAFALSFGGHGDFARTLRFLCTGEQPDGSYRPPHDYGVVIVLLGVADQVVPSAQVEVLRHGIRTFLEASHVDMVDKARAARIFEAARDEADAMPEPARTFMRYVNARDVKTLGPLLLPHIGAIANDPALSASRSPSPNAPVYLLHGTDDNVIPAIESQYLARYLDSHTRVHLLLSPLITHAELDRPARLGELWKLIAFWSGALSE